MANQGYYQQGPPQGYGGPPQQGGYPQYPPQVCRKPGIAASTVEPGEY